jgi:peptidoglycan/LPS O-acetylase OafA/YrhL
METTRKRFLVLDSLRGVFALSVVMLHLHIYQAVSEIQLFRSAASFVDFFFVLSGFVLTHGYGGKIMDATGFKRLIISRTFRLYPLYFVMLLVFIGLELLKYIAEENGFLFNNSAFTAGTSPASILPNLFLLQSWVGQGSNLSFNYPSWSISVEYYLYIIFGLILFVFTRYRHIIFCIFSTLGFISLISHSLGLNWEISSGIASFFYGAIMYKIYLLISSQRMNFWLATILEVVVALICYFLIISKGEWVQAFCVLMFGVAIIVFSFENGVISYVLSRSYFLTLGQLSYSIYITHAALIFVLISISGITSRLFDMNFTMMVVSETGEASRYMSTGSALTDNILLIAMLVFVVLVSHVTYRFIELKGISLGRGLANKYFIPKVQSVSVAGT